MNLITILLDWKTITISSFGCLQVSQDEICSIYFGMVPCGTQMSSCDVYYWF